MKRVIVFIATVTFILFASVPQVFAQGRTILDGVYSESQAERGKEAYDVGCLPCHGAGLKGFFEGGQAPPLTFAGTGYDFIKGWEAATVHELFVKIRDTMPKESAETVDETSKLDILAYILKFNEFPAGDAELILDTKALSAIMVVPEGGLSPLAAGNLVKTVGCLEEAVDKNWVLTKSSGVIRTKSPMPSEGFALEAAVTESLGDQTIRLFDVWPNPEVHKGHRMEAKGLFMSGLNDRVTLMSSADGRVTDEADSEAPSEEMSDASGQGINVLSLEMIAETCSR